MATLATQQISQTGLGASYASAAGGGDAFTPDDKTFLHVKNGSGASINVTLTPTGTYDGLALGALVIAVPAGADRMIKPPAAEILRDPSTGLAAITYSAVTTVTIAALRR